MEETCFGKIIDLVKGKEFYIKQLPCALGRISSKDNYSYYEAKSSVGKTINIDTTNYFDSNLVDGNNLRHKLILSNCKRIYPIHFILYYDFKSRDFKLKSPGPCQIISGSKHTPLEGDQGITLSNLDMISINCELCNTPHMYKFIFPQTKPDQEDFDLQHQANTTAIKKLPDINLYVSWTSHRKESLKKLLLIYGYGRWEVIKQNSGGVLTDKPDLELRVFSNAFIKTLLELIPTEKNELRNFLINLIEEYPDDPYIVPKRDDWGGNILKQRAPAWGKRIQLLCRVRMIIEKFKNERKNNKEIRKKRESLLATGDENLIAEANSLEVNKTFDYWENLLNFLPEHAFYGQRPSIWWTRQHDIDLLRGTYKYGYANYNQMRQDPKLSFCRLNRDSSFQDFPVADTITRRLKKLIQLIIKWESNQGIISFEDRKNVQEPTGFNLEEKRKITEVLIDYGVPLNNEGKSDWARLRDYLLNKKVIDSSKTPQMIERLVQRLRMIAQLVIDFNQGKHNESNDASGDDNMLDQMDPDNDGFTITPEQAEKLNKNMNMLHFIRKHIIPNNCKLFENGLKSLVDNSKDFKENWDCSYHDRTILIYADEHGLSMLKNLVNEFKVDITYEGILNRLNYLCEFYRDFISSAKAKKKREGTHLHISQNISGAKTNVGGVQGEKTAEVKKKLSKLTIQKDEEGNIIYPIVINSSLSILNLGRIDPDKTAYHSEKNLFPIGYKAIREHASMTKLGERALYTCEILDGGAKPIYKLTPHEDVDNPIIKESSTGCWIVVCNRINTLQGNKREKVTVSGTERFGLSDPNVVRLLQVLPNAEKCSRYVFKTFEEER